MTGVDRPRIEAAVTELLLAIGEDPSRPGLVKTPKRVADSYAEFFGGLEVDPVSHLQDSVPLGSSDDGLPQTSDAVIVRGIDFRSICEHHLLPFVGIVHVAYLPGDRVVGLGKLADVVETLSTRPQLQERLTEEIADALQAGLAARGVLVVMDAVPPLRRGTGLASGRQLDRHGRQPRRADRSRRPRRAHGAHRRDRPVAETAASVVDTVILGVLNVTPDSFSDGGLWIDTDAAIAHATALVAEGADLIDVGGESTRPGAERVDPIAEQRRVIPVIAALSAAGIAVSVDTMNSSTAVEAVAAGAAVVNDVSGGLADPDMAAAVAGLDVHYVAMHWRGHSKHMNELARYGDVVADVRSELAEQGGGAAGRRHQFRPHHPRSGLGFAKRAEHDWQLLGNLDALATLGHPMLVGASRKRFLGALLPADAPVAERDLPTAVVSALSARAGVWGVRVHDVVGTRRALDVVRAWQGGERG